MKTLEEFNEAQLKKHDRPSGKEPILNGIACPNCGQELYDTFPMITLSSAPPRKNIHCSECGYSGNRFA